MRRCQFNLRVLFHCAPAQSSHFNFITSSQELRQHLRFRRHSPDQSTRVEVSFARADEPWLLADRFWFRQLQADGDTHLQSAKLRVTSSYPANQSCYSFGPSRKHYFWGAQFSFSSADVLCEVPYDPQLQMFLSCTSATWLATLTDNSKHQPPKTAVGQGAMMAFVAP